MIAEKDQFERIQEYLQDRMPEEDRAAFERDLATDDVLRGRFEELSLLARSVRKACQEADLRVTLDETERQLGETSFMAEDYASIEVECVRAEEELSRIGARIDESAKEAPRENKKRIGHHRLYSFLKWTSYALAACFAAAVCMVGILDYQTYIVGKGYDFMSFESRIRGRGTDNIIQAIDEGSIRDALSLIDSYREKINNDLTSCTEEDLDVVYELEADLRELDFLEAVCYLRQGTYFKARKKLQGIMAEDSIYGGDAYRLFNELPLCSK